MLISSDQGVLGCNMFAYCNNNPCLYIDPSGLEGVVGFGFQVDVSTEHGTYGFEIVFYLDEEVVYNTTQDASDKLAVVAYTYTGVSANLEEMALVPQLYEKLSSIDLSYFNDLTVDEQLIALAAILEGCDFSGSFFIIYGHDNFDSAESYSEAFSTWSVKYTGTNPIFSGGLYYSYSDTCWAVGVQGSISTKPKIGLMPLSVQYSQTYYSDPVLLF